MRTYTIATLTLLQYALTEILNLKPFRMCTYKKQAGGTGSLLSHFRVDNAAAVAYIPEARICNALSYARSQAQATAKVGRFHLVRA